MEGPCDNQNIVFSVWPRWIGVLGNAYPGMDYELP